MPEQWILFRAVPSVLGDSIQFYSSHCWLRAIIYFERISMLHMRRILCEMTKIDLKMWKNNGRKKQQLENRIKEKWSLQIDCYEKCDQRWICCQIISRNELNYQNKMTLNGCALLNATCHHHNNNNNNNKKNWQATLKSQ